MSRMIWGKIKNDGTKQQRLDFGNGEIPEKVTASKNNILGRGYSPIHAADPTMHGPSGGGDRNANAHRQPTLRHKPKIFNPAYTRESIEDVRKRNTNVTVSQTGIERSLVAKAFLGDSAETIPKTLFQGVVIQINTGVLCEDISAYHMEQLVNYYGGKVTYFGGKFVTHVVTNSLSATKTLTATKRMGRASGGASYVRPEWIIHSLRKGVRLPETDFGIPLINDPSNVTLTSFSERNKTPAIFKKEFVKGEKKEQIKSERRIKRERGVSVTSTKRQQVEVIEIL
eukprot:TRINITY_DN8432_c0_g1_i2.p1 TRINITY_DN8432_c0_g1~~TRINITY_DN8432_c0_g1_i2.p1  ORF type:complete len:284 (+),score=28.96 TRINITY_DN8432_c0_g1_i2:87-938(+)